MQTFLIRIFRTGLLGAMLWLLLPLAFTACDRPDAEVDISLSSDYRGIAEAIRSGGQTLSETLSLIETAVAGGFADQAAADKLLQQAVAAMGGTVEEKLSLIEAAVKSQTAGLETKLELIGAAAAVGFADAAAQQSLIAAAIASVAGEAGEKLSAVETAVQGQTASLAMKLGLIEEAVKEGLSDEKEGWELLQKALDALGEDAAGRLAAIAEAMASQAAGLSAKLDLLSEAIKKELAEEQASFALVQQAVEALDGTVDEKLAAVDTAIQRQGLSLEAKLGLIEAAVSAGFADAAAQEALLLKAIEGLSGTAETKLAAIEAAVRNQGATLSSKLGLIESAVSAGFAADTVQSALIRKALAALSGTTAEKLGAIDTAMTRQTASLATKLEAIQQTYADSLANAGEALALIEKAVSALDTVEAKKVLEKLRSIESTSLNSLVVEALNNIKRTIQGLHDYKEILAAIETAIEDLNIPITIEFEDFVTFDMTSGEPLLVMGDTIGGLRVPYLLPSNDFQVEATGSDGAEVTVEPDPDDPLRGYLRISANWKDEEQSKVVELTISSPLKSETYTMNLVRERLEADPKNQDKNLNYNDSFDEANPLIFTYKTNTPGIVTIPDSVSSWVHLLYASSNADGHTRDTIKLAIDSNRGFKLRSAGFTVTNRVSTDILTFLINQDYNKTIINFEDSGLKDYLVASGKDPVVDINRDKEIEMAEAVYVTSLNTLFDSGSTKGRSYTSFNEFQYFTGITILRDGSFNHWTGLEEITFPESLTSIESGNGDEAGILTDCPKLTTIQGKFSVDGRAVVYNKTLLAVATGDDTSYSIPDGVTTLGSRSVYGVKELGVPASVTQIRNSAFADTSTVNQDTLYVYFRGVTPPTCEEHPLGDANWNPVKVLVPAVIKNGSVDVDQTNARIAQFKAAFRNNANDVKFAYYTDWPFEEGIPMAATLARKQAYACDARPKDSIPGVWFTNEHIAVLYEVGGVRKRADARITAVKPGGEATIRFTVDKNAPEDIACTLVFPLSAAKEDNTTAKTYSEMTGPQDGTPDGCFDVHVGSATFHTTNSVQTGKVQLSPVHAIFKLSLGSSIDADHPLTVKDEAGNVITTVKPKTGMDLAYVAIPVTANTGKYYKFSAQTAEKKVISLSGNYVIEKGKAYLGSVDQYNGHEYVDLGLSSGLKWATCNVGATKPEEEGDFFAWGETAEKSKYSWDTYFDTKDGGVTFTEYAKDKKTLLDADDDAARQNWGGSWRIPTKEEWNELMDNCNISWKKQGTRKGYLFTSKKNDNTLFLPAADFVSEGGSSDGNLGHYWSSSLSETLSDRAWVLSFESNCMEWVKCTRSYGVPVRPVSE